MTNAYIAPFGELLHADDVPTMPSGEMVAPVIRCFERDEPGWFPLNIPNTNQVADLPAGVAVESICTVDGGGVRGATTSSSLSRSRSACVACRARRSSRWRPRSPATVTPCSRR